ncbi:cryptochrome/photolyase family protein [Alteromonas sp. 5E99-2]|uniref:cryptochrome/photolyase family protein n=1 Tax=Alteromonas sp. 5E99-2 TaxID=2817683 RepID=UPI001A988416|nr:cryptochrome/photolyase family protein [Alteromonas sp. 5E99-2]MBO1254734.1 cryptochrome/photolyase family protein [Alteromonas sp. 5E99-2]
MSSATLIYPHQLFEHHPAISKSRPVYLIEEPLILTYNPIHTAKLMLHKLTMDVYEGLLQSNGHQVYRIRLQDIQTNADVFALLHQRGIHEIHVADTTDAYLEKALEHSNLQRVWYETPCFLLTKNGALSRYKKSKKFMANFYKTLRKDMNILMEDGKPVGGKWSFDEDNRKKIPKQEVLPEEIAFIESSRIQAAKVWAENTSAETYGEGKCWLPTTHSEAKSYFIHFLHHRFDKFGPYEDAITQRGIRLWHSGLSPLINIGLLTPKYIVKTALQYACENAVPINSLEGFVRQIIGWREFIRASYESDGNTMRTSNFFQHNNTLKPQFWTGDTQLPAVDNAIKNALDTGYNHHIERLMVMGNVMLLSEIHPNEVYRWFMAMYIDAYDWVMVPNVYGMSQFADGGSFATKPYIAGANYIKKMSDYKSGAWEQTWTGLYWHFIHKNINIFKANHRLSMMPRLLEKMDEQTRQRHLRSAEKFIFHQKT